MFDAPRPSWRRAAAPLALAGLCLAVGCGDADAPRGSGSRSESSSATGSCPPADEVTTPPTSAAPTPAPTVTAPAAPLPTDLVVTDLSEGTGGEVGRGDLAFVDYIGANSSNGVVFDQSYGRAPFPVVVGAGSVIAGWDQGLVGMKVGGRRQLVIPPALGYGDRAQGDIPANETLVFVIDLRAVAERPTPEPGPKGGVAELCVNDDVGGFGPRAAESGDRVSVHYVGVHGDDGEPFDASWDRGQPIDVVLGAGQVIPGWDQGLVGVRVGTHRRLVIPADLAYGAEGRPPTIRPNETLVFEVDVVGVEPGAGG